MADVADLRIKAADLERRQREIKSGLLVLQMKQKGRRRGRGPRGADRNDFLVSTLFLRPLLSFV